MKCLFLLCLCLVPIVVFSSTFTSQNPIDLPTDTTPCTPVLDTNGKSPNSDAPCPDGVFRYNSDVGPSGTPVRFIPLSGANICEDQLLNIQFNIPTVKLCVSYTIWKVGINAYLRTMLLETGGTIGQADSSYFKIVKSSKIGYNLVYCPLTPFICPLCPDDQFCAKVGVVIQNGKRRLALVNENPLDVYFKQV
ncbi:hypothetical protein H5410_017631 [Solanum commersonii]|uniref:Uncharacterized protein n=1 Tax=Solanum commersonii TaxID=4109 RepID=A0A9J6A104_SOLCO|nr:hypothetical protein H5410_017631 [Solanum commersonii]